MHGLTPLHAPDQPAKTAPGLGRALRRTFDPSPYETVQSGWHTYPFGSRCTQPWRGPSFVTRSSRSRPCHCITRQIASGSDALTPHAPGVAALPSTVQPNETLLPTSWLEPSHHERTFVSGLK